MKSERTNCVGVVCLRGEDVLLIQRGTAPRKGEWSIPGGRIEPGDRLHDYLARWDSGEPKAGDDADKACFVPLSEIDSLGMWPETVRVIKEGYEKMALFSQSKA